MRRFCRSVPNPITPRPIARPFSVNFLTFSRPAIPSDFSRKSEQRQSRNTVASKIASVSFHSSYLAKFMLDKMLETVRDSDERSMISEHRLDALMSIPSILYDTESGQLATTLLQYYL